MARAPTTPSVDIVTTLDSARKATPLAAFRYVCQPCCCLAHVVVVATWRRHHLVVGCAASLSAGVPLIVALSPLTPAPLLTSAFIGISPRHHCNRVMTLRCGVARCVCRSQASSACGAGKLADWRYGPGSCVPSTACPLASSCSACTNTFGCGWCATSTASLCAYSDEYGSGPLRSSCSGRWAHSNSSRCLPLPASQCAVASDCASCLRTTATVYNPLGAVASTVRCSWCDTPSGSTRQCLPNDAASRAMCATLPSLTTCTERCRSFQSLNRSGEIRVGSLATPESDIEFVYPADTSQCYWYITPTKHSGYVPANRDEQLPIVDFRIQQMDVLAGDSILVYEDFGETHLLAEFEGADSPQLTPQDNVRSKSGQLKVVLRSRGNGGGLGFHGTWRAAAKATVDIYFVVGIVVAVVCVCLCCLCGINKLLARMRPPPSAVEDMDLAQTIEHGQRTGEGAAPAIIASFPCFQFDAKHVKEVPLLGHDQADLVVRAAVSGVTQSQFVLECGMSRSPSVLLATHRWRWFRARCSRIMC